jgi:eukaryotic-like serine/threonine-protein kinase
MATNALAFFAIGVAAYMSMRALGIGPAGSLLAKGVLADRDRIIVADFDVAAQDTTLGSIVTEAFRTDLAQSRAVQVVPPSAVRQTLTLMRRPTDARIDLPLAREIAARDGIKAVVDGEVRQIGGSYLLTARLVQASTGDPIDSFRETAASAGELIAAIEQLSRKLRTRIGESIRGIRTEPALAQVTTQSLPALRSYVDGARLADEGDFAGAVKQLEEAIRLDSGFAMAYRKLAVIMNNNGLNPQRADTMALRAYQLRERLPEREKYLAEAYYHTTRLGYDADKATSAYRALLDIDSLNPIGLNNLSLILMKQREYAAAESLLTRAVALNDGSPSALYNLVVVQFNQGKIDEASRSLARARQLAPRAGTADMMHVNMLTASLQFDAARRALDSLATRKNDIRFRIFNQQLNVILDQVRGRISSSERSQSALVALQREAAGVDARLSAELDFALNDVWFREDTARAIARAERALRATPMTSVPLIERPYVTLGLLYAISGRPDRARAVMNEMLSAFGTSVPQEIVDASRSFLQYGILLAEGRGREAAAVIRSMPADQMCYVCVISFAGYAFDRAGMTDSARVQFERYLETPSMERAGQDARFLAGIYKRLGEFSEERGDKAGALSNYRRFVELWKDADPELQPRVKAVRDRVAALQKLVPA